MSAAAANRPALSDDFGPVVLVGDFLNAHDRASANHQQAFEVAEILGPRNHFAVDFAGRVKINNYPPFFASRHWFSPPRLLLGCRLNPKNEHELIITHWVKKIN